MPTNKKFLSIKSLIVWVVMAITALSLILISAVTLYSQIGTYRQAQLDEVRMFSKIVSRSTAKALKEDDGVTADNNLQVLSASELIENVHVYKIDKDQKLVFFASYNKSGIAPVKTKFDEVQSLREPKTIASTVEFIAPIEDDGKLLGHVYLRASTEIMEDLIARSISITLGILLISLALCLLLTLKLQRTITKPIEALVKLVQRISRQKDFSRRAETYGIKELDILSSSFNSMLARTQEHIQRQVDAEEDHRKLNINLEEKVAQRTLALKEANSELIQTLEKLHQFQRQMVQNEKMASLGDMVAGVAHEVNTPIGLGVTASTMMLDRLTDMKKQFEDKTLKASVLAKFIQEGQENLNIIYRNLNRAADLISSFKQVAVDQSSENNRIFSFTKLMDEILLSMRPKLKKVKHEIKLDCPDDLYIESKAGPINQIMINLIMNSIIHGFEFIDKGTINISVRMLDSNKIKIIFKDNGKGLAQHLHKRIFDPFVTTKRGQGGSGLGMHLVYNLITQALNGSISISSEEEQGVEFTIIFPVKKIETNNIPKISMF
ncbi:MAG: signal transduction histidine kinase [Paraglaciecola sp.]|jgi:signal transduction histidine kinase